MLKTTLIRNKDKQEISLEEGYGDKPCVVTTTFRRVNGVFRAASRSTAGTTKIVEPNGNNAIVLTDIIISADRVNAATVTVQFNDGTRAVEIFSAVTTDAPVAIAIPFQGNWAGWQSADLELVTVNAVTANVSVGYFEIDEDRALSYSEWDARR